MTKSSKYLGKLAYENDKKIKACFTFIIKKKQKER